MHAVLISVRFLVPRIAERFIVREPPKSFAQVLRILATALLFVLAGCGGAENRESTATPIAPPSQTTPPSQSASGTKTLSVAPMAQQTEVWCWAAAAEMIFRYYGVPNINPNYQCGIVAAYFGGQCSINCFSCVSAIGPMSNLQVLINNYGTVAGQFGPSRVLSSRLLFAPLTFAQTIAEVNSGRPIVAGISPNGFSYPNLSEHFVVVVGYDANSAEPKLIVNDPFPYMAFPAQPNPYLQLGGHQLRPGQYSISYAAMINFLRWANTIDQIR